MYHTLLKYQLQITVVIEDAAWDTLPTEESEIAAFDNNGNMVGFNYLVL